METILGKFHLFKLDSGKGFFLPVFPTPFYGCFQTLNRNRVIKDLSKSGSFSLSNALKYLGARLLYSLFVKVHIFSEMSLPLSLSVSLSVCL